MGKGARLSPASAFFFLFVAVLIGLQQLGLRHFGWGVLHTCTKLGAGPGLCLVGLGVLGFDKEALAHKDSLQRTALHVAAQDCNVESVRELISAGMDVNLADVEGATPLHLAVAAVPVFLAKIARRHQREQSLTGIVASMANFISHEPAFLARKYTDACVQTADLLMNEGASLTLRDAKGISPFGLAVANGLPGVVKLFLDHKEPAPPRLEALLSDATTLEPLHVAAQRGHVAVLRLLLNFSAKTNAESSSSPSASRRRWDVNAANDLGFTPLHLAAAKGHAEAADLLLALGAEPSPNENELKFTPLHVAAHGGHADVVAVLLRRGARAETLDFAGHTALWEACASGRVEAASVLIQHGAAGAGAGVGADCLSAARAFVDEAKAGAGAGTMKGDEEESEF